MLGTDLQWNDAIGALDLQWQWGVHSTYHGAELRALRLRDRRVQDDLHHRRRLRGPRHLPGGELLAKIRRSSVHHERAVPQ